MYAVDFEYDGRYLSQYGFIICNFDGASDMNIADTGFDISFTKARRNGGRRYGLVGSEYENCVECTFQICKDPCDCSDPTISGEEYADLARWLNRREFLRFRVIGDDDDERQPCYFNASFNIKKIYVADILYGLELTAETDSPFGYGAMTDRQWTIQSAGQSIELLDLSGDIGYINPDITISCRDGGTLSISNDLYDEAMTIRNCTAGETIQIYGSTQIIESSNSAHKLYDDFNFVFPKVGNTLDNRRNRITVSMPCTIRIQYTPIIKDIP